MLFKKTRGRLTTDHQLRRLSYSQKRQVLELEKAFYLRVHAIDCFLERRLLAALKVLSRADSAGYPMDERQRLFDNFDAVRQALVKRIRRQFFRRVAEEI